MDRTVTKTSLWRKLSSSVMDVQDGGWDSRTYVMKCRAAGQGELLLAASVGTSAYPVGYIVH